jgi:hypothetical protein
MEEGGLCLIQHQGVMNLARIRLQADRPSARFVTYMKADDPGNRQNEAFEFTLWAEDLAEVSSGAFLVFSTSPSR